MRISVISSFFNYLLEIFVGWRATLNSSLTVIPYLFGAGDLSKEVTEQYPDPVSCRTEDDLPPKTRGLLFNDINRCTGCGDCTKICPVKCIQLEAEQGPEISKLWVSSFNIDFGKCIFCGLCVVVCEPNSLTHTRQYEGSVFSLRDLVSEFGRGKVSKEQRHKWEQMRGGDDLDL